MKERLLEVLNRERYRIKDLAEWLGISKQAAYNKVNGKTLWTYDDLKALRLKLGTKNFDYIFFS